MTNEEAARIITFIYEEAVANLPAEDIDHHCSDLYLCKTPEASALIRRYKFANQVTTFRSHLDGKIWYEIPFAFTPYWTDPHKYT